MMPAVPVRRPANIRVPVELKRKPGWRFEPTSRLFLSKSGKRFTPHHDLPKNSRIVYKVPHLAKADAVSLSKHEGDLRRYMQVILPAPESPQAHLPAIRAWPSVAEAHV